MGVQEEIEENPKHLKKSDYVACYILACEIIEEGHKILQVFGHDIKFVCEDGRK